MNAKGKNGNTENEFGNNFLSSHTCAAHPPTQPSHNSDGDPHFIAGQQNEVRSYAQHGGGSPARVNGGAVLLGLSRTRSHYLSLP